MEKKKLDKVSCILLVFSIICIVIIIGLIILNLVANDQNNEYPRTYSNNCYKVENDDNTITMTTYQSSGKIIYEEDKFYLKDGQIVQEIKKTYYTTKALAKKDYETYKETYKDEKIYKNWKLYDNCVEVEYVYNDENIDYPSEEIEQKFKSFTTNEELINYIYELNESNNFNLSSDYERIY